MTQRLKELAQMLRSESRDEDDEFYERRFRMYAEKLESAIAPQWQPAPVPINDTIKTYWLACESGRVCMGRVIKRIADGAGSSKHVFVDDAGLRIYEPIVKWMDIERPEFPEPPGGVG